MLKKDMKWGKIRTIDIILIKVILLDYTGMQCPVCEKTFKQQDDIVVCPECGTPHHRECYFTLSHCVNEEKHAEGFVFKPAEMDQKTIEPDEQPEFSRFSSPEEEARATGQNGNVFQAPFPGGFGNMGIDFGTNPKIADIPLEEVLAFVGNDPNSSRLVFKLSLIDRFKTQRFNFVAFLFPYIWFFYRKMYKIGAVIMAVMLLLSVAFTSKATVKSMKDTAGYYLQAVRGEITLEQFEEAVNSVEYESAQENSVLYTTVPQVLNLAIRFFIAFTANRLYLEHMKKQVLKTREECSSMDEYMAALRVKGGTSVLAAVLSVLAYGVLYIGAFALMYKIYF